jgi:cell division septal protein FtsQ
MSPKATVRAATEKNFRRAKVRPTKRKSGALSWLTWRLARWAVAIAIVSYAGYCATNLVLHASALQVRHISVHGNVRLSSGEVREIIDGLRGSSILTADLPRYRRQLLASPWVADVALRRVLPSTVEVFVSERRPIGLCRLRSELYLIDAEGTLIAQYGPQYAEFDLPIIDGLLRPPSSGQPTVDERRAELAARALDAIAQRRDLAQRVSQIDVSDAHDVIVLMQNDPAMVHLGEERFLERLQAYVDLAPALRDRVPEMDYVDMRFEQRVYVRPAENKKGRRAGL